MRLRVEEISKLKIKDQDYRSKIEELSLYFGLPLKINN